MSDVQPPMIATSEEIAWLQRNGRTRFDYRWIDIPGRARMRHAVVEIAEGRVAKAKAVGGDFSPREIFEAVLDAERRRHATRSEAAQRAGVTRARRQAAAVYATARRLLDSGKLPGPRSHCAICGKALEDAASIQRGIGSECWQRVLATFERMRKGPEQLAVFDG